MKKIILIVIILAAGIAFGLYLQKQSKTQKLETQMQTDMKEGVQKADAIAADVKEDVHKAGDMATNVAAQVKADAQKVVQATTNVVGEAKEKLH